MTHLKSPSSFSCCTSLDTIGLINTLLTIVPMTKYPKMLTGPSQPVLQRRRKRGWLRSQTEGHPWAARALSCRLSSPSQDFGGQHCTRQKSLGRAEPPHPHVQCPCSYSSSCNVGARLQNRAERCAQGSGRALTCGSTGTCSRPV